MNRLCVHKFPNTFPNPLMEKTVWEECTLLSQPVSFQVYNAFSSVVYVCVCIIFSSRVAYLEEAGPFIYEISCHSQMPRIFFFRYYRFLAVQPPRRRGGGKKSDDDALWEGPRYKSLLLLYRCTKHQSLFNCISFRHSNVIAEMCTARLLHKTPITLVALFRVKVFLVCSGRRGKC